MLASRPWGTSVQLELDGLPDAGRYVAWVWSERAERQQAATWGPTDTNTADVTGAVAMATPEFASVRITEEQGHVLATVAVR